MSANLTLIELWQKLDNPPQGSNRNQMKSEFHKRLIDMFDACSSCHSLRCPLPSAGRRGQRAYRFGLALVILIVTHEIIEQGAVATRTSGTSPYLTMWLPFGIVAVFAAWRFWLTAFVLKKDRMESAIDRVSLVTNAAWAWLARQVGLGARS